MLRQRLELRVSMEKAVAQESSRAATARSALQELAQQLVRQSWVLLLCRLEEMPLGCSGLLQQAAHTIPPSVNTVPYMAHLAYSLEPTGCLHRATAATHWSESSTGRS